MDFKWHVDQARHQLGQRIRSPPGAIENEVNYLAHLRSDRLPLTYRFQAGGRVGKSTTIGIHREEEHLRQSLLNQAELSMRHNWIRQKFGVPASAHRVVHVGKYAHP